MEVLKCVFVFLIVFKIMHRVDCSTNCNLSLKKDFSNPVSPVYIQNGEFLAPNTRSGDTVVVRRNSVVLIGCPGERRRVILGNNTQDNNVVEARCKSGTTFEVGVWEGNFRDIRCNGQPWFTAEENGEPCYAGSRIYKVGYKLENNFYTLYEACFDKNLLTTLYVKHQLTAIKESQRGGHRPQFIEGNLFGKVSMSELYKVQNQRARFTELLGPDMDHLYISKNQFLTRGHLAPRADFPMLATQRASFHYVNAAPQWMRGNAGDWAALEDALRRRVQSFNSSLTVYTGTHGVSTLANRQGKSTELYLSTDSNNNNIVPVPLYFYKLVYDPSQQTAIAFVMINSSFYNKTTVTNLQFCSDMCEDGPYNWLRWRNDGAHSFCCSYEQFVGKVLELPRLKVRGLFY